MTRGNMIRSFHSLRSATALSGFGTLLLSLPGTLAAQQATPPAVTPHPAPEAIPETTFDVPQAVRTALAFPRYALDIKLEAASAAMHVRAIVTVKNTSAAPLATIPLQISSTLAWETIEADGKKLSFAR
ncbi:MAG: hypothetical protein JWM54_1766, partial [Acidobacteriaceae bacterium]|nr:hypothetical protein [Acidobacteriaceae bacterium]